MEGMGGKMKGEVRRINGKRVATTEYRAWQMMKNRCTNKRSRDWPYYGGRGITFTARWNNFEVFLADMGRKPDPKLTLERIDNDLPYAKWNCVWATRRAQSRNRGYYNKLNAQQAEEIRNLYASGSYYQYELADIYDITQAHVSQIVRNVCWERGDK